MTTPNDHKPKPLIDPLCKHQSTPIKSTQDLMKTLLDEISPSTTYFSFSPSELELSNTIYTLIKDLFQQTNLSYLKHYLTHKPIYPSSINRIKCLKILFFILSRFYNKIFIYEKGFDFFTNINNMIIRLYIDAHLTLSDIELIIKFYFTLSCLNMNDNLMRMRNYNIKNYEFIEIAFTLLINIFIKYNSNNQLSPAEQNAIVNVLNYFKRKFIINNYINIVYLTNQCYVNKINVFDLLQLLLKNPFKLQEQIENDVVYNEIKSLFIAIYKYNFTYEKFMLPILNIMKDVLVNFNTHSISQLKYNFQCINFIIQYLHDVSFEENKTARTDMCNVCNTFYFGKKDAGLLLKPGKIVNDNITIIFSFKLLCSSTKKEKYIVIGFSTEKMSLCLLLERNSNDREFKLMMKISEMKKDDVVVDTLIRVNENKTYIYALNLSRNYIELQSNNKQQHYKCTSNGFNISAGSQVHVGYHPKDDIKQEFTFNGFIGTVIGLTKVDSEYVSKILSLKGEYEYILYNSKFVFDERNTHIKKAALHDDIARYLLDNKSQEHIAFIISPQVFQLKKLKDIYNKTIKLSINVYHRTRTRSNRASTPDKANKVYYNEYSNFLNLDSSMLVGQSIETISTFDQKFNVCTLKKTLKEFVKSDGLKYISLIFEYYYQILMLYKAHQRQNELNEIIKLMENNLVFIFLFLYTFLEDVNHDTYLNDIKQVFYIMNNVIALYIEIGGNVIKIFYHVELIMINYLDKLTTHPSPECLEFVRCFCSILLNPKFYYEENFDKIENFFCSLQNTITNPNEFLTESMLIQICNLSEQIFPYEKEKPFLIQSYYTLLTHLLSDNTSSNRNSNSNDNNNSNNSNINRFFSIILDHMKKLGFDEQAYVDNSNNNDNGVLGKQDELILISNENDFDDMAAASTPFGEPEQPCLTSSLLTVYHFIKVLHISNYISRLSQKNKKYITSSFLFYFRHYLSKDNASELQQKTAKLLVIIMFDYYIKLNPSKENNKILRDNISKLNFTPMLAETIISTAIAATSLDDKLAFSKHTTLLSFNTSEIPHTQVIYLFQLICYIMCRNFHALQRERGMKLFNDFIDTYDLLKRCFDSVLQIHTSNIFYIDFFSESWGFMVKLYEFYFRVFLEGEEIFENEYESFHSGRSPFCLLDDNNNNNNSYKRKHMYIDFKHKLVNDFLEISAKLALGHINPFTHKVIYLLFTKGKEDNMQDFFELLTSTMEFYIKNVTVSSSYRKYYLINLLSFYSKLNLLLITKSKISEHLYKRNTELCCKFFGLFKETTLIYSLIGVEIGQTVKLISEAIFDNYIEMYLANTDNPDERVRKLIVDELDAMIFCDPTNLDKPVSTPIKRLSFNYDSDDTNIHNDNNNTHRSEFSATMCLLIERKINSAVLKTLDDIVDSIVNEKKYNILRDVHVSVFFLTKTVLQAYVLGNNCLPLLEKIRKLSKYLIKEVIHTQNMKLTQSKHGLYNKFVSILKERIKMKAQQRYDEVYALMLEACKQYYHNTAQCQEDITIFRAFDLNKTVWRTPGRRLSKNYGNGNGNGMQHMLLSPPQSFKSNLSADDNSNHNHHGNKQGNNYSTTSLPSLRTHSSPKDEIMTRTMSWHFEQDYGSNSESNDFGDLFLEVQEGDSKDNKEEKKENGSSSSKGSWLSIFKWRKNSTSVEQQQQIVRSNNNDNDKQKQQRKIEECDFLFEELLMDFNPVNKSKQRVKHDKKPTPKPFTQLNHKWSLTNPKTQLLKSHFALAFKHVYFHSDTFIHMKHAYFTYTNLPSLNKASKQLNFPSKIKNFSNTTEPPLFLKYDKHFFTNKYFPISHSYVKKPRSLLHERTIPFITTINTNNDEPPKYTFTCELINLDKSIYGNIHLYKHYLIFISNTNDPRCDNNDPKVKLNFIFGSIKNDRITTNNKTCLMFYYEIKEILIRRFLFLWQSIEIFHKNGKSYFINFFSETTCNEFFVALQQTLPSKSKTLITNNTKDIIAIVMDYQKKWIEKRISTYQYLLYINKYSSRSYKDVNQYPILPWLLKKSERIFDVNFGSFSCNNKQKDNNDKKEHVNRSYELCLVKEEKTFMNTVDACNKQKNNFRELHYPISMQNEDKRMIAMIRYEESKREEKFAYHLGTFYSTASYVFYYLMRLGPFMRSLIKLQNGAQENPNRMFDSLKDTQEILDNSTDNRELIPEFFACVEFLLNLNCSFFGVKYGNKVVDDVTFQHGNSLAKYIQFVLAHRKLLNSTRISSHIRCWIDYTYGVNQLSSDATSCTVFSVNSYAQKVKLNAKLMKMKHKSAKHNNGVIDYASVYNKMNDKVLIILNFGQAPFQVFTSKHPNRNEHQSGNDDEYDDDKGHQTNSENTLVDDYELLGKLIHYISQKIKVKGVSDIVCGRYYVHSASYDKMCFITCNGVIAVCKEIPLRQTYENDNVDVYKLQGFHLENPKQMKRLLQLNETVVLPEWSFCMLNEFSICVTCGYLSNAICITRLKENNVHDSTYIIMEDFVRAVCKITETTFMIGLNSGKLIEHKLSFTNNNNNNVKSTTPERCIQAHLSSISIIEYIPLLDIIVTVGDDNYIYIRKYFDFELLSVIKVNSNYKVLSVKISNVNCLYVLVYDQVKDGKNVMVVGYTLNGVEFARSECGMFTNMEVLENSNVVVGCCDETCQPAEQKRKGSHLHILKGSYLTMLGSLRIKKSEEMKLTFIKYNSVKKMLYCFFNEETKVFQVLNEDEDETVMFH